MSYPLDSLTITCLRGLRNAEFSGLSSVNLLVGANN
jgi:hypothetical protein